MRIIGNDPSTPRQAQIVASGTLSTGATVVVNADGTVSAVVQTGEAAAIESKTIFETGNTEHMGGTYDSNSNRVVFVYKDGANSGYGTAVVGVVSGTTISFGTPVIYSSINTNWSNATFDSFNNKVVVTYYQNNVDDSYSVVATVSGTSISFGTPVQWSSAAGTSQISSTFDSSQNKVVVCFRGGASSSGRAIVGTVSGTSISFGSEITFNSGDTRYPICGFDSTNNKVIVAFNEESISSDVRVVVGTVSGSSISFGSETSTGMTSSGKTAVVHDSANNKMVIVARDSSSSSGYGAAVVGTVSGTSISFGSKVVFTDYTLGGDRGGPVASFDTDLQKVVILAGSFSTARVYVGTVSGTTISFTDPITSANLTGTSDTAACLYDTAAQKTVIGYADAQNSNRGTANVVQLSTLAQNLTAENYIGTAATGAANAQRASINLKGAVDENQSGLTAGQSYFVQTDGTLGTTAGDPSVFAGTAVSATKLIVKG